MTLLHRLASILHWLVGRKKAEQDLNDDVQAFIELAAADKMRQGVPSAEARRQAVLDLGGVEQTKERVRDARPAPGWTMSGETSGTLFGCVRETLASAPSLC